MLPHPWTEFYSSSFSHQESEACGHFWLRPLWPFPLSLYGERERGGKRRGKRFRSPSRYRSRSSSGERRGRGSRFRQQSRERCDRYSDLERSRRSRSPSPLKKSYDQHPALAIFIANAPVIKETRASITHAILGNAPSTARGLGSAPTPPELLRSEAVSRDAVTRAAHRFLRRRSVLNSVPYVT